jgi:hypothetical protein
MFITTNINKPLYDNQKQGGSIKHNLIMEQGTKR